MIYLKTVTCAFDVKVIDAQFVDMVGGVWGSYDVDTIALRVSMGITPGGHIPGLGVESLAAI